MINNSLECRRCDYQVGSVINGMYRVERTLGEGAFGRVYAVSSIGDNSIYALKLLKMWTVSMNERKKLMQRFVQEYETGLINNAYLVRSIANGYAEGNPFIVMEYCPGGDLWDAYHKGYIQLNKAAYEILCGLKALHVNGKVHRDLKPENILIKATGEIALTDFGIAGDRNKRMTEMSLNGAPQEVMGTYAYMPKEQINPKRGDATVLPTTDIFAFGVIMYQMLTGKLPFGKLDTERELYDYISNICSGRWNRESLIKIPEGREWLPLIEGCIRSDFTKRLQTADAVLALVPGLNKDKYKTEICEVPPVVNGMALRIMQGEEYGRVYLLNEMLRRNGKNIITMGRDDIGVTNDVLIKEVQSCYVSRKHCTLEYNPMKQEWIIREGQFDTRSKGNWKESVNGTYVGSEEVSVNGKVVVPGDIISIGDVKMRLEGY